MKLSDTTLSLFKNFSTINQSILIKKGNQISVKKYLFKNKSRAYIQKNSVNKSLKLILSILK